MALHSHCTMNAEPKIKKKHEDDTMTSVSYPHMRQRARNSQ